MIVPTPTARWETPSQSAAVTSHSPTPLRPTTAAFGLILASAGHRRGWPVARGGSRAITDALASLLTAPQSGAMWLFQALGLGELLVILILTPGLHLLVNMIGYKIGVKEVPW
jgi:CDP-diglyceride synthetase